jgi:hypothetical protein
VKRPAGIASPPVLGIRPEAWARTLLCGLEEKVDLILKSVADDGDELIARLDQVYQRD